MSDDESCGLCGRRQADGYAVADDTRLCHGDARISCYVRWTVYGQRPVDAVLLQSAVAALTAENAALRDAFENMRPYMLRFTDAPYEHVLFKPDTMNNCYFCGTERYQPHAEHCTWANIKRTWSDVLAVGLSIKETPDA